MAFLARKVKKGLFEVQGLEAFIEARLVELKQALGLKGKASGVAAAVGPAPIKTPTPKEVSPTAKAAAPAKAKHAAPVRAPRAKAGPKAPAGVVSVDAVVAQLEAALAAHPEARALARAGKQKDQLLRALVPLYLVKGRKLEVSSGATSKFWAAHGVTFAAPNAAKALREHKGFSRRTAQGLVIEARGVAYVEKALAGA